MDITSNLRLVTRQYNVTESWPWQSTPCVHCGSPAQFAIAAAEADIQYPSAMWLRCPRCGRGSVDNSGLVSPAPRPFREPQGMPQTDASVWSEVRACLAGGANVAAVMLCRKLLFHIAVAHGLPDKDSKGRAPTFTEAVEHLETAGLVTSKMRTWVDRIKDRGNEANHEISPISAEAATDVAAFTFQLLLLAYEIDAIMKKSEPEAAEG